MAKDKTYHEIKLENNPNVVLGELTEETVIKVRAEIIISVPKGTKMVSYDNGSSSLLIDGVEYHPDVVFYVNDENGNSSKDVKVSTMDNISLLDVEEPLIRVHIPKNV